MNKLALLVLILVAGCAKHPQATSRESLQIMKLLYAACNTKDEALLQRVEAKLIELEKLEKVTAEEAASFRGIITIARAGEWKKAEEEAFTLSKDQIR